MSGVFSPTRAEIKERTLRTDKWWLQPLLTFGVLFSFVIYATFRAFEGDNYYKDHLISPFYSPCLSEACVPEATIGGWTPVSAEIFNFALTSIDHFDLPTRFPYDLLLLSQGVLPCILDVTTSLCGC